MLMRTVCLASPNVVAAAEMGCARQSMRHNRDPQLVQRSLHGRRRLMPTVDWPWAIILCRFSDIAAEPRPPSYYVDLFAQNGTGGICDYWRGVSFNSLDLTGSTVFGWFGMAHASSDVSRLTFPGDRSQLVQWGLDAAAANGVDLSAFRR